MAAETRGDPPDLPSVVVWGASGHASVVAEIIRLEGRHRLLGFIDDVDPTRKGTVFRGYTVLGGREWLAEFGGQVRVVPGFGDCKGRIRLMHMLDDMGIKLASTVHPASVVSGDAVLGEGTVVAAGAVINPGVRVGRAVIVNTSSSLDHDTVVGDGAHICPGVRVAGNAIIGAGAWVGIGATVLNGVSVGAGAVIGAGAVVNRLVADGVVAYGVPARPRREAGPHGEDGF